MRHRIVVGLKPSLDYQVLLDLALSFLAPDGTLHLVSLVQVGNNDDELKRLAATRETLEVMADSIRADGRQVTTEVQITSVGTGLELTHIADRLGADLLVIGLAKRSRVGKALLGSDAQNALLNAGCPVLASHLT